MARFESRATSTDRQLAGNTPVRCGDEKIIRGNWLVANAAAIPWRQLVGGKLSASDGTTLAIVDVVLREKHEPLIHAKRDPDSNDRVERFNLEPFRSGRFEAVVLSAAKVTAVTAEVRRLEALKALAEEHRQVDALRRAEARARAEEIRQQEALREEERQRNQDAVDRLRINASRQFDLLLFDLDDTLLETGHLADFRGTASLAPDNPEAYLASLRERSRTVRRVISQEILELLRERFPGLAIGVCSRAPRAYVHALLEDFYPRMRWDSVVAYEDVRGRTKPAPNGLLLAMSLAGVEDAGRVAFVGDDYVDVLAAYQAGAVALVLTEAWEIDWWRNRGNPNRTRHFKTMDSLPDGLLKEPMELPSALVEPWSKLPALEAWDRCDQLHADPGGRVEEIKHFHPELHMEWVSCHVLGRYFSAHSHLYDFTPRRIAHRVTRRILEAKDGSDYPESWVACCRWYVLRLVQRFRHSFVSPKRVIVCPVPARSERSQRLERLLDRLRDSLPDSHGIVVEHGILRFSAGARANKELGQTARFRNIEQHLSVANKELVAGATVIVIDDVTTTGSTFYYADRYLRAAGAVDVHCVALTQTIS